MMENKCHDYDDSEENYHHLRIVVFILPEVVMEIMIISNKMNINYDNLH